MALAKIYRITDCNGQNWLIQADSFAEAERKFLEWESTDPPEETTELIEGIVSTEDMILGGTRDDSIGNYEQVGLHPVRYPSTDWTLSNNMATTGTELIAAIKDQILSPEATSRIQELRQAIDKYEDIPF